MAPKPQKFSLGSLLARGADDLAEELDALEGKAPARRDREQKPSRDLSECVSAAQVLNAVGAKADEDDDEKDILDALHDDSDVTACAMREELERLKARN